jgi:protein-S-isoprenylcysteine O-methyltransferase Ste14
MYVGLAGALVGHAIARRSWAALLPAAAFVAVVDRFQIRDEELAMRTRFEDEYDEYVARVPRWLGR